MNYDLVFKYFLAPQNYFWKWADFGKVAEWKDGATICYTEDLIAIIRSLNDSGVPSMGVLLLILAACNDSWQKNNGGPGIIYGLLMVLPQETAMEDEKMHVYIEDAFKGLNLIAQLPSHLRKDHARSHLIQEIISNEFIEINSGDAIGITDEVATFSIRGRIFMQSQHTPAITRKSFLGDLLCLAQIAKKYPDAQHLERKLRTNLPAIPLPAPIEIPEEKKQGDLLQQLLEEPRTTHISRLAKKMLAALHIPMHLQSSGGASYGGVSDITNRGSFDKLLLSELAADNTLLLTRLVHNEALYLRREEPPNNPKTRRLILLDTTIKLWGTPRVFAVSAAIACTQKLRPNETVEAYTLGGTKFAETNLATTEGVLKTLEGLDAALHCTTALSACVAEAGSAGQNDTIFITGEEMITEPAFQKWLVSAGDALDFIITVNGSGELHFSSVSAGRLKQLSRAKIDLEEVLIEKATQVKKSITTLNELPAFLREKFAPLLFPVIGTLPSYPTYSPTLGVAIVMEDRRLFYWVQTAKAAQELISHIGSGDCYLGFGKTEVLYALLDSVDSGIQDDLQLYTIHLKTGTVSSTTITIRREMKDYAVFTDECFYFKIDPLPNHAVAIVNCKYASVSYSNYERSGFAFGRGVNTVHPVRDLVNQKYNIVRRITKVFIDTFNQICLGEKFICAPSTHSNHISLYQGASTPVNVAQKIAERLALTDNPGIFFSQFMWGDGSILVVDGRGFLHLRSSDEDLPEVTIVSIQGKSTTCWAADGTVCGNPHFYRDAIKIISVQHFYSKYITPFIQTILQKA